ncbi:phospholipid scramblase 1-like [Drosophila biarmipes]|uniref:phospholipid scramblase 1-like n=1 Tax=Drosophila biarmipes TaxID=125945 RepID=UPI0007E75F2C|nr:phospholipid scramblase 1-like [Drosophila biarmipes]
MSKELFVPKFILYYIFLDPRTLISAMTETLGLDCLVHLDSVMVYQKVDYADVFLGFTSNRRYSITSGPNDKPILYAVQDNNFWTREFGSKYNMTIRVMNAAKTDLMVVSKAKHHDCCEGPKVDVFAPPGNKIGWVRYHEGCCWDHMEIHEPKGQLLYKVIPYSSFKDNKFRIVDRNNKVVGKIFKKYAGFFQEAFSKADNFRVEFKDASVRTKAFFLATAFYIDAVFHEGRRF